MPTIGPSGYESPDSLIPAQFAASVTPSDGSNLTHGICRALYVGVGGNVVVQAPGLAASVTFANVASGSILPVQCRRVLATGTTASQIVALY